ncbi:hypothetical protein C2S53_000915 [Perilla frutescens var. hirtella]|uniref:Uncharacterized protein n=1 Tax=Perilla frutescens var. hirtella TaxID=608512 RepID=A0AAD4JJ55_PERFH|nr:hypothetical protein C2S53_000915 [Perilla frutescens var. hirtella]
MGGRDSTSKKKLKRDKISSKKKSRRKESKKRRRSYDSFSSSSDDDSLYLEHSLSTTSKSGHRRRITKNKKRRRDSSLSTYSESSDSDSSSADYKIRKARRSRVGSKDIKTKGRKRSVSSIGDVDATSGRKRKRLGRDHVIRPIKKSSKKKSKKVLGSSSGSDSESCSTCQSGSSSSRSDVKPQRKKLVYGKEKERLRGRGSDKGNKKHKDRSPSCTSIGRGGYPVFSVGNSDEEFFPVDNSRRLRSVITVVNRPYDEEDNMLEKDPHKEEIVYDQNDYPSPKSLDSNEGGSKMESDNQFNVAFSDKICVENIGGEDGHELGKSRNDEVDHSNVGDRQSEGACSEKEKEIDTSVPVAALGGDVLESILRQKALENLRKFRERPRKSPRSNMVKINNETNVAKLSGGTVDIVQNKSIEQGSSDAQEIGEVVKLPDSEYVEKKPGVGDLSITQRETAEVLELPDSENVEMKPGTATLSITHSHNGAALLECSEEDISAYSRAVVAKAVSGSSTSPGAEGTKVCSSSNVELTSSVEPTSGEHSSEKRNEANDGSQFEQKTMSVMRGGEVVQVSYKVYIPKKAPGLARRQLKR